MTNYCIKNTFDKPIKITINKDGKKEDLILLPKEERVMPKLAGAKVEFEEPVNISFRHKEPVSKRFKLGTKVVKDMQEGVVALNIPDEFVLLKIKDLTHSE
jgi:hypothetical protein